MFDASHEFHDYWIVLYLFCMNDQFRCLNDDKKQ